MTPRNQPHPERKRLKCPNCNSIRMIVFEGERIIEEKRYPDGSGVSEQREYPLEIKCWQCGHIVRQEGGAF
jgi:Zn finger protein HypA/HybF involved in hydrogenase expression